MALKQSSEECNQPACSFASCFDQIWSPLFWVVPGLNSALTCLIETPGLQFYSHHSETVLQSCVLYILNIFKPSKPVKFGLSVPSVCFCWKQFSFVVKGSNIYGMWKAYWEHRGMVKAAQLISHSVSPKRIFCRCFILQKAAFEIHKEFKCAQWQHRTFLPRESDIGFNKPKNSRAPLNLWVFEAHVLVQSRMPRFWGVQDKGQNGEQQCY